MSKKTTKKSATTSLSSTNGGLYDDDDEDVDDDDNGSEVVVVELKISLPDKSTHTLRIKRNLNADQVYETLVKTIDMPDDLVKYFYLYEVIDNSFGKSSVFMFNS